MITDSSLHIDKDSWFCVELLRIKTTKGSVGMNAIAKVLPRQAQQ